MATVNKDFIVKNGIIAGEEVQGSQIIATTSSLAPLSVTSSAVVGNLNSDLLDGQDGTYYLNWENASNKPSPTIVFSGDVSGSVTLTNLTSGSVSLTVISDAVELGADTTGNYVATLEAGTGVTLSASAGEGISSTISIGQDISITASPTFGHITVSAEDGTQPFTLSSSAVVNNLNSQYVGGYSIQNIIDRSGVTSVNGTAGEIEVSASTGAIVVGLPSDVNIAGSLTVGENFIVTGSVVTVNSTVVTIDDPVFTLGGDTAPTLDDGKDRGIEFRYYSESAKIGFFGFDDSTGKFTFLTDATNESDVFTGTKATIDAYIDWEDVLNKVITWEDVTNKPSPIIVLDGDVSGSGTMTGLGSASIVVNIVKDFSLTFNGDVSGTGLISDLNSASITLNIQPDSVTLGTDTVGDYISNIYGTPDQVIVTGNGGETASVTLSLPQNIATTSTPTFAGTNFDNGSITTASVTVTINDSATVIDSFSASTFATAEYIIQAKQDTKMTSTKILVMWDGTNAYISEYAIVDSSGGAANVTLSVSESSGILSLEATSPDAASTNIVIKAIRTSINA